MPRPAKGRVICRLPKCNSFSCDNKTNSHENQQAVVISVDEYETIRLIDFEGLTQEECANQMSVARTTVQHIYNTARRKLSAFLVNGGNLTIDGGTYSICPKHDCGCKLNRCGSKTCSCAKPINCPHKAE